MRKGVVIFLILFATKTAAADLSKCVALENDIERLSCYDEAVLLGEETICDSVTSADLERCSSVMMNVIKERKK